jgi:membrane associated rhomboid family serine protease
MADTSGALQRITDDHGPLRDWPIVLIGVALAAAFVFQTFVLGDRAVDYGVSAQALREGRWWTLLTAMFIHAGLFHLVMNMSALSIGAPVYQRLGRNLKGTLLFFALYFACGLAGGLTFVALNPNGTVPAVGASGAIFGLWGALARIGPGGGVYPLLSQAVWRHAWAAIKQNLVLIGILFVLGLLAGGGGLKLAWEAHAGGFLTGLLLIAPLARLAGLGRSAQARPWG